MTLVQRRLCPHFGRKIKTLWTQKPAYGFAGFYRTTAWGPGWSKPPLTNLERIYKNSTKQRASPRALQNILNCQKQLHIAKIRAQYSGGHKNTFESYAEHFVSTFQDQRKYLWTQNPFYTALMSPTDITTFLNN